MVRSEVLVRAAISIDPCKDPFDHPSSEMDNESGLVSEFPDDLYRDGGGLPDALAIAGAVGIGALDEGVGLAGPREQGHRAVVVLHISAMDQQFKRATIGIDHGVALAPHDLLARILSARHTCFGALRALAVDDRRLWHRFSPCPDAVDLDKMGVETFEDPVVVQNANHR